MSRVIQFTDFKSLNIRLIDQMFEFVGDSNAVEIPIPVLPTVPIKTMLTKGSIRFEIPDIGYSEPATGPGIILPGPNALGQTKFNTIALEDDTHIHCIQPLQSGETIIYTDSTLAVGESIDISKGNLVFAFGDNYTVNSDTYSDFRIFAVQNSDIVINAINETRVIIFKAVVQ